jgi:hypothetical protein
MNASSLLRICRLILPLLGLMLAGSLTGCDAGSSESDAASRDFTFTALVNGERYTATSIIGAGISASGRSCTSSWKTTPKSRSPRNSLSARTPSIPTSGYLYAKLQVHSRSGTIVKALRERLL